MKILLAVHHFPPRYTSGAEKEAFRAASGLKRRGHEVRVVTVESTQAAPGSGLTWVDETFEGIPVRRLSFCQADIPDPSRFEYDNPWLGAHVKGMLEQDPPDLLFFVSGYLMTASVIHAAKMCSIPVVLYLTDFWFLCPRITLLRSNGELSGFNPRPADCVQCLGEEKRRYLWLGQLAPGLMKFYWSRQREAMMRIEERQRFLRETLGMVDLFIVQSNFLKKVFTETGIPSDKIAMVRQGLENIGDRHLSTLEIPKSPSLRLGYIGQIAKHKGVHLLIRAVRELKNMPVELEIYGDDSIFPRYRQTLFRLAGRDPRIHFMGPFRGLEEIARIYQRLDLLVVPSLWYENSPNVILEAFSYRVPVIAAGIGGMAELVRDGVDGLHFRFGDYKDLARIIRRVVEESDLLKNLRGGITNVRSLEEQIDQMSGLLALVVGYAKDER